MGDSLLVMVLAGSCGSWEVPQSSGQRERKPFRLWNVDRGLGLDPRCY